MLKSARGKTFSINQSISQSINQAIDPSIHQPINQSINRSIDQLMDESINQSSIQQNVQGITSNSCSEVGSVMVSFSFSLLESAWGMAGLSFSLKKYCRVDAPKWKHMSGKICCGLFFSSLIFPTKVPCAAKSNPSCQAIRGVMQAKSTYCSPNREEKAFWALHDAPTPAIRKNISELITDPRSKSPRCTFSFSPINQSINGSMGRTNQSINQSINRGLTACTREQETWSIAKSTASGFLPKR